MAGQTHIRTKINEDETYVKDKRVSEQIPLQFTSNKFDSGDAHIVTPHDIHDLLLAGLRVPVKRTLLAVAGLPGCDKSKSLMAMLNEVVTVCNEAMAPLSFLNTGNGMPYCELAAGGSLQKQPKYSEATRNTCYLYAMEFCINEYYRHCRHKIGKFDNSASEVKFFKDNDLDLHFRHILQCLNKNHESPSSTHTWQAIPNGLAEINIWDINRSKSIYHFLPALWGHLDRSYLWLFLDLDHDKSKLHQLPSVPENGDLIMRYHTNLYYFLRYTMLVKSHRHYRENVCSLFAMNESGNLDGIYSIEGHIKEAAMQMGVKALINEPITPLQQRVNNVELLSGKLDSLANEILNSSQEIPLSFVFLRSLFYVHERIYITKDELQSKGHDLGMSNDDLNDFCKFFMSSGSFIDVSQIDKTSPYVIVKPMRFLRELDKIFYPQCDSDSQITGYGLVTEEKAKAIFGQEYQFFMDVLVSVDLAIKLKGNRIDFEGTPPLSPDHTYYYMPDVRVEPPDLTCHPSALNLLLDISCPLSHLQVVFAKAYFANVSQQSSLLVLKKNTPINITNFRTKSINSSEEINFQLRYLGNVIEIHLPKVDLLADEAFCTDVVRACNKMMIDDWGHTKYAFAVTCSGHENANYFHCVRHILPHDGQCKRCKENDSLKLWNKAIVKNEVPKFKQLKKGTPIRLTSSENVMFQEKLEKLQSELDDTKEQKEMLVAEVKNLESQLRQQNKELQEANDEMMKENRDYHNTHEKGEEEEEPNPNVTENGEMQILREDDHGLHVAAEKKFCNEGNTLDWADYGFKMHFPQGTTPPEVLIKALVGGKFQFPNGMELVSALYLVSISEEFHQPVELEIQHCVCLKSSQQCKYLSFITAPIDVPPYKFKFIEGGKFYTDSQYGMIALSHFCLMGICKKINGGEQHNPDVEEDSSSEESTPSSTSTSDSEIQSTSEKAGVQSINIDVSKTGKEELTESISSDTKEPHEKTCDDDDVQDTEKQKEKYAQSQQSELFFPEIPSGSVVHIRGGLERHEVNELVHEICDRLTQLQSISLGVQVPDDSCVPVNRYTGIVYYEREGSNKWLMWFNVVQNINVFLQYIKNNHPNAVRDEMVRFSFLDPVNGCIELITNKKQELPYTGWKILPHKRPLLLTKKDADLFGSHYPIPPYCLVTIRANLTQDTEEDLSYAVPLKGIDSDIEIFINRSLEIETNNNTTVIGATSHQTRQLDISHCSERQTVPLQCDIRKLRQLIVTTINKNYARLSDLIETCIREVANEFFQVQLINESVKNNPTSEKILKEFTSGMEWIDYQSDMEERCKKFLEVCQKMGGNFLLVSKTFKHEWIEATKQEMGISLSLDL